MAYILNKASILCRPVFRKNIISGPINKNTLVKGYEHLTNRTNPWAEQKYKLKDNISNGYRLVYREHVIFSRTIVCTYYLGWIGIAGSLFSIGYLVYMKPPIHNLETEGLFHDGFLKPLSNLGRALLLIVSFSLAVVLMVGSKAIPFRIYHNSVEKVYKAVFVSRILGKKQIETFGEGTVVPLFSRRRLGDVLFKINGRIVLLDQMCFPAPNIREQMICKSE